MQVALAVLTVAAGACILWLPLAASHRALAVLALGAAAAKAGWRVAAGPDRPVALRLDALGNLVVQRANGRHDTAIVAPGTTVLPQLISLTYQLEACSRYQRWMAKLGRNPTLLLTPDMMDRDHWRRLSLLLRWQRQMPARSSK
jgi:hypothetical protein